jgi:hypothetical protein
MFLAFFRVIVCLLRAENKWYNARAFATHVRKQRQVCLICDFKPLFLLKRFSFTSSTWNLSAG